MVVVIKNIIPIFVRAPVQCILVLRNVAAPVLRGSPLILLILFVVVRNFAIRVNCGVMMQRAAFFFIRSLRGILCLILHLLLVLVSHFSNHLSNCVHIRLHRLGIRVNMYILFTILFFFFFFFFFFIQLTPHATGGHGRGTQQPWVPGSF